MPQRKEIYEEILLGSVGTFDPDATARELRRDCEAVLAQSPWVVVVDECHNFATCGTNSSAVSTTLPSSASSWSEP